MWEIKMFAFFYIFDSKWKGQGQVGQVGQKVKLGAHFGVIRKFMPTFLIAAH